MRPSRSPNSWVLAGALALAAGWPRPAACDAPLEIRAEPSSLVAGTAQTAALLIDAGSETPPTLTTSAGRIENVRPLGGGRFSADYAPPSAAHPQVAIVAATSGDRWGWTSIPLSGRGVATARSAPGAAIRVTIGDASFGPVRADDAGNARVPVIVPAGVAYAYHGGERLELNVPPTLHVHVALGRGEAPADVEQAVPFRVFAVTAAGAPRAGAPLRAEVDRGDVAAVVEIAPGEYAGTWRLPPGAAEKATVRVHLADEPGFTATAGLDRVAGSAARVSLEAERRRVVAGDGEPLVVRVRVTDAAGNAVDAAPSLRVTGGELSPPRAVDRGTWDASLSVPRATRAGTALVTARAREVEGQLAIEVTPPPGSGGPREPRWSLAPKAGVAGARGGVWSPMLAVEGGYRAAVLDGRLALLIEAGAFARNRTDDVQVGAQAVGVRGRVRYVPLIASARIEQPTGARQLAWAAAGAGVALVESNVSVGSVEARSESAVVPGLRAAIGWGLRAGRATPFAEAGLAWQGDPRLDALRGSLTVLTVSLGCRYAAY